MSVDISVSITEDIVDIIATPTVNIVNVTNSASIDPSLYDLSEFTNTSPNPFVRTSGLSSYVPTSRTLTINGTTQDLSANRTFTIPTDLTVGTTPIASGTIGRVLFQGTGNVLQQSSSLFWDSTNNRLGIGTSTPASSIHIATNNASVFTQGTFGSSSSTGVILRFQNQDNTLQSFIFSTGTSYTSGTYQSGQLNMGSGASGGVAIRTSNAANAHIRFHSGNADPDLSPEIARFVSNTGNLLINTTTDAGFRLDVNGTARVQGLTTLSGTMTASGAIARNQLINGTLVAAANGDTLVGVDINPTFTNGAFTGVTNYGIRSYLNISGIYDGLQIRNTAAAANAQSRIKFDNDITPTQTSTGGVIFYTSSAFSGFPSNSFGLWNYNSSGVIALATNATERMRIFSTGNVGINTTTDAGFRLDVNGTARVSSNFQANANVIFGTSNGFYWDSANQRLGLGTNSPQVVFHIQTGTSEKLRLETSGTIGNFVTFYNSGVRKGYLGRSSSNDDLVYFNEAATGNLIFGSNGTERMRIKSNGVINMSAIPTSPVGLSSGDLWNNLGILTIV
jgi:hypothetical protein